MPAGYSKSVVGLTITNTYSGGEPPEVPYTGDANNALLYGVLALSSLAGFGAIVVGKRRKKKIISFDEQAGATRPPSLAI